MAVRSEGRVGLYLQDKHPLREAIGYATYAEERGFEAVWQAESRLVREATVPMAAYAATTDHIAIGSGVVNCWTRNVGLLAATFVDPRRPGARAGSSSGSARGGTRSRRRWGSSATTRSP